MGNLYYSLKAKCQGCAALKLDTGAYVCTLGVPVHSEEDAGGNPTQPAPDGVKCWKPITAKDLSDAALFMKPQATHADSTRTAV